MEKKANSLQTPQNPLAMENKNSCEPLAPDDRQALEYVIANSLNSLKKTLCEVVEGWNNRWYYFFVIDISQIWKSTDVQLKLYEVATLGKGQVATQYKLAIQQ